MNDPAGRRPLKVRGTRLANDIARWLSRKNITPNQISLFSVAFAALAASCLAALPHGPSAGKWLLPLLAAMCIQCRLLCNLFDGMVAVEEGKSTPAGELYNDLPDRIADPLILIAAGYAITVVGWAATAGWCAGLLAVMTAYVRTLSASIGAPVNFQGPMAKQHRMAIMTVACVLSAGEEIVWWQGYILPGALLLIIAGCVITIYRRTMSAYRYLSSNNNA